LPASDCTITAADLVIETRLSSDWARSRTALQLRIEQSPMPLPEARK